MQADRFNSGKPKYSLMDLKLMLPMIEVLEYGTNKYKRDNWRKGLPVTEICDSLMRHLAAFLDGENFDVESGKSHIGHMMCNLMFLQHVMSDPEMRSKFDDRFQILVEKEIPF